MSKEQTISDQISECEDKIAYYKESKNGDKYVQEACEQQVRHYQTELNRLKKLTGKEKLSLKKNNTAQEAGIRIATAAGVEVREATKRQKNNPYSNHR